MKILKNVFVTILILFFLTNNSWSKSASEFIWCQEEPRNQGAWYGQRHRLNRVLKNIGLKKEFRLMSRPPSSAPAVGQMKIHIEQQKKLIDLTLGKD